MGVQAHVKLADLRRNCANVSLTFEVLTNDVDEPDTLVLRVLCMAMDGAMLTFNVTSGNDELLGALEHGDATCWVDCNSWSAGQEICAWLLRVGAPFQVY